LFVTLDLVGALYTWRDEFGIRLGGVLVVPPLNWELWLALTGCGSAAIIFEGSYRVRRRVEAERDAATALAKEIGLERPMIYVDLRLDAHHTAAGIELKGVEFRFKNQGPRLLQYVTHLNSVLVDGRQIAVVKEPDKTSHIGQDILMGSGWDLANPVPILPICVIEVDFDITYDNVPELRARIMGRRVKLVTNSVFPLSGENYVLDSRET
jgi:hypothetical protein